MGIQKLLKQKRTTIFILLILASSLILLARSAYFDFSYYTFEYSEKSVKFRVPSSFDVSTEFENGNLERFVLSARTESRKKYTKDNDVLVKQVKIYKVTSGGSPSDIYQNIIENLYYMFSKKNGITTYKSNNNAIYQDGQRVLRVFDVANEGEFIVECGQGDVGCTYYDEVINGVNIKYFVENSVEMSPLNISREVEQIIVSMICGSKLLEGC